MGRNILKKNHLVQKGSEGYWTKLLSNEIKHYLILNYYNFYVNKLDNWTKNDKI